MTVVHLSPTYFDPRSVIAGAERYTYELAKAMAPKVQTRLVTFGPDAFVRRDGDLTIRCYRPLTMIRGNVANPWSLGHLRDVLEADVVHCHQLATVVTDLAVLLGWACRKPVFMTDLAGSADVSLWYHLPLWKGLRALLLISEHNRDRFRHLPVPQEIIYGGGDALRFAPQEIPRTRRLLHVGRILPHKGIHHLLAVLPEGVGADIVGSVRDPAYYEQLQAQSRGRDVLFHTRLGDEAVIGLYQRAWVTVLPATADSGFTAALESLACGTPVIGTAVGSLPELIEDGVTGWIVPPDDPTALRAAIDTALSDPLRAEAMGRRGRAVVLERFTWEAVVARCLKAYARCGVARWPARKSGILPT